MSDILGPYVAEHYDVLEQISSKDGIVLFKGIRKAENKPVIIKALNSVANAKVFC